MNAKIFLGSLQCLSCDSSLLLTNISMVCESLFQFPWSNLTFAYSFGRKGCIRDPRTIQFLLEISQALHHDENFVNLKDDNQPGRLISQFVSLVKLIFTYILECWDCLWWQTGNPSGCLTFIAALHCQVDYGAEIESQLAFLVECRGTFGSIRGFKVKSR